MFSVLAAASVKCVTKQTQKQKTTWNTWSIINDNLDAFNMYRIIYQQCERRYNFGTLASTPMFLLPRNTLWMRVLQWWRSWIPIVNKWEWYIPLRRPAVVCLKRWVFIKTEERKKRFLFLKCVMLARLQSYLMLFGHLEVWRARVNQAKKSSVRTWFWDGLCSHETTSRIFCWSRGFGRQPVDCVLEAFGTWTRHSNQQEMSLVRC